ncbi:HNH endonuclease signature motif containing protein [Pseudomonas shirazensis]|uniref:HNH endonuclease signature motif containing protein n=1 Tax=Pseudomonas shirazensis TaxID=2745494 RepID=UPI003D2A15E0
MRQFELDDVLLAAAGDANAQMRVERRQDVLKWNAEQRKSALQCATPSWVDLKAVKAVYAESRRLTAETGVKHEVDHIIPIRGKRVCGLHVPWNLRVITKAANARKHAKFGDEDVVGFLTELGYEIVYGINKLKRAIRFGKREWVLLIDQGLRETLSVAYVHGEFVIDPGPQLIEGEPFPHVAISRANKPDSSPSA